MLPFLYTATLLPFFFPSFILSFLSPSSYHSFLSSCLSASLSCLPCLVGGTWGGRLKLDSCLECPENHYCPPACPAARGCPPGSFSPVGANVSTACIMAL